MTDKELLELAANAAEIDIQWFKHANGTTGGPYVGNSGWNPLTNDGDALRLAVKLGIDVGDAQFRWYDKTSTDPYAATRRAIVCAAAEIGKAEGEKDE